MYNTFDEEHFPKYKDETSVPAAVGLIAVLVLLTSLLFWIEHTDLLGM